MNYTATQEDDNVNKKVDEKDDELFENECALKDENSKQTKSPENDFLEFHKDINVKIVDYNNIHNTGSFETENKTGLDSLVANERKIMIKAFVNDAGEIENEYSVFNKVYLNIIKKISENAYENKKNILDDKIIEKYAKKRLDTLENLARDAKECADTTIKKRQFYLKLHSTLEKEYGITLDEADQFNEARKKCLTHLESLKEKKRNGDNSKELFDAYIQAEEDKNELSKCFRHANKRANAIKERMEINYPRLVETELYAETLTEQALSLNVAHEFYSDLYKDTKTARAIKLKSFVEWNKRMDMFFGEYNKIVDQSAKDIVELFNSYKKNGNLFEGKNLLEKYGKQIHETHENLLSSLKKAKTNIIDLRI
jgi:hypothetical protein